MLKGSKIRTFGLFLILLGLFCGLFWFLVPSVRPTVERVAQTVTKERWTMVAIGDSLTEGVGDTTQKGGYVPLLGKALEKNYDVRVKTKNFGVSGNTSQQILKRMTENKAIQKSLKSAKLMTVTVGGNDVLKVVKGNLSNLTVSSFKQPQKAYQKRLRQIIDLARRDNPQLPIYIMGIYNPFYLNFPDLTAMQDIIDNWNEATLAVTQSYQGVYFVPINDLLYKGIDGKGGITQETSGNISISNDALYDGDHFHPNNRGYAIMAEATMEKIRDTQSNW
ncbi:SGNH/GDSL hydrolase family protein [Streptococcus sp. DD12]|uniref:SGNH/GDSL hydrolase family protein n=1 Tax=Streptococcus sp. DD12 TaxID=1777880 RepID=UPI00079C03FF|nr:SGNH/GDSL hydrolase family protein [Streptococcus sp. DD12]KXT76262.1 Lipase/Acylhydrolase with GDSL-like motif [Streptococcus sp. DD12]